MLFAFDLYRIKEWDIDLIRLELYHALGKGNMAVMPTVLQSWV